MADHTKIEWTDATWSPITVCTIVDAGDDLYTKRAPWASNPWVVAITFLPALGNIDGEGQ